MATSFSSPAGLGIKQVGQGYSCNGIFVDGHIVKLYEYLMIFNCLIGNFTSKTECSLL